MTCFDGLLPGYLLGLVVGVALAIFVVRVSRCENCCQNIKTDDE